MLAALTILAVQNTSPVIALVVLGQRTMALPLAVWLLGAIAIGTLTTLLLYGLSNLASPPRRPYRPMGQRLSSPEPGADPPSRDGPSAATERPSSSVYESDWESFQAPEQWADWGQRPDPERIAADRGAPQGSSRGPFRFKREPYRTDEAVQEIESGWDDDRVTGVSYRGVSPVEESLEDIAAGWDEADSDYPDEELYDQTGYDQTAGRDNFDMTDARDAAPGGPNAAPDDIYDADYRVIIPPYKPLDEEDDWGPEDDPTPKSA
jgi:hypothetical protein